MQEALLSRDGSGVVTAGWGIVARVAQTCKAGLAVYGLPLRNAKLLWCQRTAEAKEQKAAKGKESRAVVAAQLLVRQSLKGCTMWTDATSPGTQLRTVEYTVGETAWDGSKQAGSLAFVATGVTQPVVALTERGGERIAIPCRDGDDEWLQVCVCAVDAPAGTSQEGRALRCPYHDGGGHQRFPGGARYRISGVALTREECLGPREPRRR